MKRQPALIPFSHDHHHALVAARRLRRAADQPEAASAAASSFLTFFADETVRHFREEEELLFPLVVSFDDARQLLVEALLEHQRLHALATRLRHLVETGAAVSDVMRELAQLLEAHIRLEERELFPLIERLLANAELPELPRAPRAGAAATGQPETAGAHRELGSGELNVTLLSWKPGTGPPEHVNDERDVLVVVLDGSATLSVDGEQHELGRGEPVVFAKGQRRRITAGRAGVRYLSVHRRRPPLQIGPCAAEHKPI